MAKSETNNSGSSPFPIFGRVQELAYLHDRIERPGLTTLAARPQQGKTRLFEKLRDDLRAPTSGDQTHLIGYAVATAEYPDLLLRSIENLYTHWLKDSDFYSQAKAAIAQQKGKWMNWLGKSGESLADLLRFKDPTGLSTKAVQGWFTQLLNANETLKTGGFTLPRLSYEQARDLLQLVYDITDKPVVLVFDAFEQSPDTEKERGNLKLFLEKMYDWPPTHCLLACRAPAKGEAEDLAYTIASELARDYATAELYTLKPMQLDALDQRDNVLAFLHEKVPATRSMKDDEVLALLDGYPGTLRRWHDIKPTDRDALVQAAENAQKTRYPEMPGIFDALLADQDHPGLFEAAARLTLRPEMPSITVDDPLVALALKEDGEHLDGLTSAELLEETDQTYQFGLTARYEYARRVLMETPDWKQKLKTIVEAWVIDLAGQIRALDASEAPYALALAVLTEKTVAMSQAYYGVCMSAVSVLGMSTDIDAIRSSVDLAKKEARISILVAKGLTNATTLTETLDQTQPIIDALRQLSTAHPDQPVLREQLAKGLTNATTLTETLDQTQPIIDALRQLSTAHPDQPVLREQLAKGLFNGFVMAMKSGDQERAKKFFEELVALIQAHPDERGIIQVAQILAQLFEQDGGETP